MNTSAPPTYQPIDEDLVERVRSVLASSSLPVTRQAVIDVLRNIFARQGQAFGPAELAALARRVCDELTGAGPLQQLLDEPAVTDVLVNNPEDVWVERAGTLEQVELRFAGEAAVNRLARRLAAQAGARLDDASPYVDARMPDGTRLHVVLPPLARAGTAISLRVPPRRPFTLQELAGGGLMRADNIRLLVALVEARLAFLISGGTGTGKTTLLASMLGVVPHRERIVVVEDCGELSPNHPHAVRLECRASNQEGVGEVLLRDLVRQALRMRPDRLVVGEARGPEVVDLLSALNTGHEGGCATIHANRAQEVPARIEALAALTGLARQAVHSQMAAGLNVVIHLARDEQGSRRLDSICVIRRVAGGFVRAVPAATFKDGVLRRDTGYRQLMAMLDGVPLDGRWMPVDDGSSEARTEASWLKD